MECGISLGDVQRDLPEDDRPRVAKASSDLRVDVGNAVGEEGRADGRAQAAGVDVVLERNRKTMQRPEERSAGERVVGRASLLERGIGRDRDEGTEVVESFDALEEALGRLDRADLPGGQALT